MDSERFPCPISIFRHPLLQQFTLSIFCKLPTRKVQTYSDLKYTVMLRILTAIFVHRMQERQERVSSQFGKKKDAGNCVTMLRSPRWN